MSPNKTTVLIVMVALSAAIAVTTILGTMLLCPTRIC